MIGSLQAAGGKPRPAPSRPKLVTTFVTLSHLITNNHIPSFPRHPVCALASTISHNYRLVRAVLLVCINRRSCSFWVGACDSTSPQPSGSHHHHDQPTIFEVSCLARAKRQGQIPFLASTSKRGSHSLHTLLLCSSFS